MLSNYIMLLGTIHPQSLKYAPNKLMAAAVALTLQSFNKKWNSSLTFWACC